jgi:hypothetical protein
VQSVLSITVPTSTQQHAAVSWALHLLIASDMIGSPQGPLLSAQIAVSLTGTKPQNSAGILRFHAGNH